MYRNRMNLFLCFAITITLASENIVKRSHNLIPKEKQHIWNRNPDYISSGKFFQFSQNHPAMKTVENIWFLNEVEACRSQYPNYDKKTFYTHLYCNLTHKQYTIEEGGLCNMTAALMKKVEDRLESFVIFTKTPKKCEISHNSLKKRSMMNSELLNSGDQVRKPSDLSSIYLGVSIFPITTLDERVFFLNDKHESWFSTGLRKKRSDNTTKDLTVVNPNTLVFEKNSSISEPDHTICNSTYHTSNNTLGDVDRKNAAIKKLFYMFSDLIIRFSNVLNNSSSNSTVKTHKETQLEKKEEETATRKIDEGKSKRSLGRNKNKKIMYSNYITLSWVNESNGN